MAITATMTAMAIITFLELAMSWSPLEQHA
jgi:hypothetical protein